MDFLSYNTGLAEIPASYGAQEMMKKYWDLLGSPIITKGKSMV